MLSSVFNYLHVHSCITTAAAPQNTAVSSFLYKHFDAH